MNKEQIQQKINETKADLKQIEYEEKKNQSLAVCGKNTKLEQLTKAIQSAVPSIMERQLGHFNANLLTDSFGLKVDYLKNGIGFISVKIKSTMSPKECEEFDKVLNYCLEDRDITLEDCLIAIEKKQGRLHCSNITRLLFGYVKNPKEKWDDNPKSFVKPLWQFNKPLQDQSDECKELLWDLICKK